MGRLVSFDIVRIFACICILVVHFNVCVSGYDIFGKFVYDNSLVNNYYGGVYLGNIGVGIFFILSGASLEYTMGEVSLYNLKSFYLKRVKAIYPQFWIAFACATMIHFLWYKNIAHAAIEKIFVSLAGLDGYAMITVKKGYEFYQVGEWFLGCIIIIYLIYPFLSYGMHRIPILTMGTVLTIYELFAGQMMDKWFFLVFPYFILGMLFVKYFLYDKRTILWILTILAVIVRVLLSDYLYNSTVCIITCWTLFLLLVSISEKINIRSSGVKKNLAYFSTLTYPAFLVHHKLITIMAGSFNLENFPYRYTIIMFIIYMIIVYFLSVWLKNITMNIMNKLFCTVK